MAQVLYTNDAQEMALLEAEMDECNAVMLVDIAAQCGQLAAGEGAPDPAYAATCAETYTEALARWRELDARCGRRAA